MAYQSDFRPQFRLEDAGATMPCGEEIWEAADATSWHRAYAKRSGIFISICV